jgi:ribosome assembly protein SQT1
MTRDDALLNNNVEIFDEEDVEDEPPVFIDMNSAVEVKVDDSDVPMDDDEMAAVAASSREQAEAVPMIDQSRATFASHGDAVYAIASHYDPPSRTLYVVSGGGDDRAYLHLLSAAQCQTTIPLSHPHTDSISCVALNTPYIHNDISGIVQPNHIAVGSYDGSIVLYSANADIDNNYDDKNNITKSPLAPLHILEGPTDVEWVRFHPKGGTVLLTGSIADGTIWMYHTPTKSCLQVFVGHEGGVTDGAFSIDGKWVISCGEDGTVRVWAPKKGVCKHVFRLVENSGEGGGGGLTCLAVGGGPDGQLAICGGENGNAYVVHVSGKKLVATLTHYEESAAATASVANSNNANGHDNQGGGNDDGMDYEDNDHDEIVGEARSVEAVGFSPANVPGTAHWCATGGVDGVLKIWNMNFAGVGGGGGGGGVQLRQKCIRQDQRKAGITRLRWHSSLPLVVASYTDGVVCIWDARVGAMVESLTGHEDMINDMDVSFVDGSAASVIVVTGSDDKSVKIFEYHPLIR